MFKNGRFPSDSSYLQAYLEGALPGIRFEIKTENYGSGRHRCYPRTGYGRQSLEKTEGRRCEDIARYYRVKGTYNNTMSFEVRLIRCIDIEDNARDEEQEKNLAAVGGRGWPCLGNGLTSYSCDVSYSDNVSTVVRRVFDEVVTSHKRDIDFWRKKGEVIGMLYPDGDYTKRPVDFVPRDVRTHYTYTVNDFPLTPGEMQTKLETLLPGIKFDVHGCLDRNNLSTLHPEEKNAVTTLAEMEGTTLDRLISGYDVVGSYSNFMYFTFQLKREFYSRHATSLCGGKPRKLRTRLTATDTTVYPRPREYNVVLSTTFSRIANLLGIRDISLASSGGPITKQIQQLLDDYPDEDYTALDKAYQAKVKIEAPVSSSSNSSLIVRSLTATIEEAAASNLVLEERNRLLELEISNLRIQTLELTSRNASMNEKFAGEVQRVTSEMKSKIETEHRESLSTILVEKDLAIRAFQRERATHNETKKQLETTTANLSLLESSLLNSAIEKNDLKEELRKRDLERQSFLAWLNSSPLKERP